MHISVFSSIACALLIILIGAFVVTPSFACTKSSDCVPSTCCHPTSCVERDRAPKCDSEGTCENADQCLPFSLDCGGRCFCTELGECGAIVNLGNVGRMTPAKPGEVVAGPDPNTQFVALPPRSKRVKYTYGYVKVRGPAKPKKGY